MSACRRDAAPRRFENRTAFRMLHPNEAAVAIVTLVEIPYARRKSVAGLDFHAVSRNKDRANLADAIGATSGRREGPPAC